MAGDDAQALLDAGWTQGSVFLPNAYVAIPAGLERQGAFLIVCTQACSLVSMSLDKDPFVELAVATPVAVYKARSEAATGKDVRRHHLPRRRSRPSCAGNRHQLSLSPAPAASAFILARWAQNDGGGTTSSGGLAWSVLHTDCTARHACSAASTGGVRSA